MSSNSIPKKSGEDNVEGKLEPLLGSEGTAAKSQGTLGFIGKFNRQGMEWVFFT